jgi:hypothetical protein
MDRTPSRLERLAPLTGLVFALAFIVIFFISSDTPDTDARTLKWVDFYSKHDTREIAVSIAATIAIVFFVWFAGTLRARLRAVEGSPGRLSNTSFGGALLFAVGALLFIALDFTAADTVGDVPPTVTQTIGVLDNDLFFPLIAGTSVFMLASGVITLRTGALPRWLGWVAVVAGVVALTPVGFFAFLVAIVWVGVVSVLTYLRPATPAVDAGTGPTPPAPPPPAAPAV